MDKWFKSKWFVRAISLAFAILLYVFASVEQPGQGESARIFGGQDVMETVKNVPLGIRINEDKYVVSGVPETVDVSLEGSKSIVTATANSRNFDVFVDLEGLGKGRHTVEIKYGNVSDDLEVYIEPKTIEVVIEERATEEFDVNVDFINVDKLPAGYELGKLVVEPNKVTITSSKSVIDQIGIVKVFVDVEGLKESINNREVPVNVYDSQGNELRVRVEPRNVEVSAELINPSKTVPVSVETTGELPKGYTLTSITPKVEEVEVFAKSDILDKIEEVKTEKIDLSKLKESGTIKVGLALPDGAIVPELKKLEVTVELEREKTIDDVPIRIENLGNGQEAAFVKPDGPSMSITVNGNQETVDQLTADDFEITVDAEGLGNGEHSVPVTIDGPEDIAYSPEFDQVTIEIS